MRRPRLGKNSADFSEQVAEAATKCKVGVLTLLLCSHLNLLGHFQVCGWEKAAAGIPEFEEGKRGGSQ